MPIEEIIKQAIENGQVTISQDQLKGFWDKVAQLTNEPLNQIREKRVTAFSSETKLVLG